MKKFKVNQRQYANLSQLMHYFNALPKSRIKQSSGGCGLQENPYDTQCCVATHMAICLNIRKSKKSALFAYNIWDDHDLVKKETGVSFKKFQELSGRHYPWGTRPWFTSPKKVFKKLYKNAKLKR